MLSIGFFEVLLLLVLALFVLKPDQLSSSAQAIGRLLFKLRAYTSDLEQAYQKKEKQLELEKRIENAAKVSDVSDLIAKPDERE